eukprot:1411640-Amphidinium_carterae.1
MHDLGYHDALDRISNSSSCPDNPWPLGSEINWSDLDPRVRVLMKHLDLDWKVLNECCVW